MYLSDFLFDINSTLKVVNMHLQNKSFVLSLYQSTLPYKLSNIFLFFFNKYPLNCLNKTNRQVYML